MHALRFKVKYIIVFLLLSLVAGSIQAELSPSRKTQLVYLLKQDCGSCHGMTLKGGLGPALLPANLSGKPAELLVNTILEGRHGTPMPPWKDLLSEEEARFLIQHLLSGDMDDS